MARVLVLVEKGYSDYDLLNGHKIDRYMSDVKQIDGKDTERVIFENGIPGSDCFSIWFILSEKYNQYHGTADSLEGAVLVGDIPVPVFHVAPYGNSPAKKLFPVSIFIWICGIAGL
jgi:hypothetical protein